MKQVRAEFRGGFQNPDQNLKHLKPLNRKVSRSLVLILLIFSTFAGYGQAPTITVTSGYPINTVSTGVSYGNSIYVAISLNGNVYTSSDANNWTKNAELGQTLNKVTFGAGLFVVVGNSGYVATSADGITWTQRTSGTANNLTDVQLLQSKFWVTGANRTLINSSDGITWGTVTFSAGTADDMLLSISYGGGAYVIGGRDSGGSNNRVYRSTTGANNSWTYNTTLASGTSLNKIQYLKDKFYAFTTDGVYTSADGSSWANNTASMVVTLPNSSTTLLNTANGNQVFHGVYDGTKVYFYGYSSYHSSYGSIYSTTNGTSITLQAKSAYIVCSGAANLNGKYFEWGNEGFVSSDDGVNYHYSGGSYNSLAYNGNTYVAVGTTASSDGGIFTSTDWDNWTDNTPVGIKPLNGITYGNGKFIAVGNADAATFGTVATSTNGTSWTVGNSGVADALRAVTYGNNKYVAVGNNGRIIYSSDGTSWTSAETGTGYHYYGVSYVNNYFVAVGGSTTLTTGKTKVKYSSDGVTWTDVSPNIVGHFHSVTYGGGKYVLVGRDNTSGSTLFFSVNSTDITNVANFSSPSTVATSVGVAIYGGVVYGNSAFVAISNLKATPFTAYILTSSDGSTWTTTSANTTSRPRGLIYNGTAFKAVCTADTRLSITAGASSPSVSSVSVPSNGSYKAGQNLNFTVNFSDAVTVSGGTPSIPITLNTGGVVNATYQSGSGTTALVFSYTVASGNNDNDGITVGGSIALNGATIQNGSGVDAILTLNSVGSTTSVLVDAITPLVSTVSSSTANGTYKVADAIAVTVTFSEAVTITGTPTLALNSGGTASYASGTGTSTLTFNYTVGSGHSSSDLDYSATNSLALSGGTIKDAAGNDATLTLPAVGGGSSLGGQKNIVIDGAVPSVTNVGVPASATYISAQNLDFTVNFIENITVVTTGGTPYIPITLSTGGIVNASYQSGSGTSALIFRYTVVSGNADNDGVAVGAAITANGGTLQDAAGNNATLTLNSVGSTTGVLLDAITPVTSSVGVPANGTYSTGANLDFTVNFSENVTVVTSGGTPYIPITLNTGGTVNASYQSGSGTSALVFRYTVVTGNGDNNGIAVGASITANGGTIKDAAGNNAVLTLNSTGATTGVLVDALNPGVLSVAIPSNATYTAGQNLDFTVSFSQAVDVVTTGGTPYLSVTLNTVGTVNATYVSGTGTSALLFRYTVISGQNDADGISLGSSISLNGGTIKNSSLLDAVLTLSGVGSTTGILVDAVAPTVSSVSSSTANGTFKTGDVIAVTITFTEAVTVTGTPTLALNSGGSASYASGSGTSTLTFNYTIISSNSSADLDYPATSSLALAGGTIKDAAGNNATLTLPTVGGGSSLGGQKNIVIDGIAPTVSSVGVPSDGTYITAQNLDLTVNFGEAVTVVTTGGTPYISITLATGGTVNAAYLSGSGTSALAFRYTIASGNADNDGIAVGASITANGGTLKDAAGNNVTLTLNSVGSTANVKVDAIVPVTSSVGVPANGTYSTGANLDFTVNFSENVTVVTAGGTPYIPITLNTGGTVNASYLSGSGTSALVFRYTVVTGNADNNGIAVGASITANGGTIKDAAGNNANLTLNSIGATTGVLVDALNPGVLSVSVPSNATYTAGQNLDFTVTFSQAVDVVTTGGTPYLSVTLNTGGTVNASYVSGTGTSALLFRYTVMSGQNDADGISPGGSISLNGGTIKNSSLLDAVLTLSGVGSTTGILVDAIAPTVSSVSVPSDATYITGQNLDLTVQLNEPVTIVTTGGTPYISVSLATGGTVNAIYQSGSGTSSLVFRYTIINGNYDADGISVGSAINANGGTLKDAAGNNTILTLNSVANTSGVKVDAIAPAVTSVDVPSNGTYITGDNLEFKVNFDDIVTIITTGGTPYIPITLSTGGAVNAMYISGSGTNAITFRYTLVSGNSDGDGVEVGASVSANGGTLKDAAGNNATLVLNNIATATGVLVDAVAPAVATVQVPANGTYNTGKNLDFTINYNDPVTVNVSGGTPYLPVTLNTGGTVHAVYQGGSGTSALLFRYTIVAGNEDANGITVGVGITSNGGTLKDVVGNHAALTLNGVGSTASVLVDAIAPEVSSVTVPANATYIGGQHLDFTVNFNEAVTLDNTSGTPYITLTIGSGNAVNAVYVSGSGTSSLVFRYTIIAGMADNDGIAAGNSITANGAKLTDAAGNDVVLTLKGVGNTSGVKVDAIAPDVSLATTENSPTKVSGIPVTITFTEAVTGFTADDISVVNGTVANFSGSGSGYSVDLLPSAQGNVSISIAAGVAQDATGNDNTASNTVTLKYDSQAPTATISTTASDPTNSTSVPVQITFNEDVTGFTIDDIVVSNASKSNFTGSGSLYSFDLTPTDQGTVSVDVIGNIANDAAGNGNTAAIGISLLFDNQSPTIQLMHNHANDSVKGGEVVIFTATFSDANGINESNAPKITIGNLVANAAMTKSSNLVWTYQWTVPGNANETTVVSVMAQDPAGNQVTGGLNLRSFVVDNAPPVITFPTITGKITVHVKNPAVISFSEPVRMKIASLVNAVIFREGGINGTDIPFTLSSSNLKSTGNRIIFYPKAGAEALPQIVATATLKCNTTYYLALKAGSFTDMVGNDVPLVETTFQTDPLPVKPLIAQMSSATIKSKLCLGDSIGCSNFDNIHTYKWYKNGELITESSSQYYSLANNASGKYSIYVQNSATSCENWSDTITVTMYDAVMPVVHEKRKSEVISLLIADNSSNSFVNYKWTKADGSQLPGGISDNLQFLVLTGSNMNGDYRVSATDKNGCILKSEAKAIKFKDAVANLYPTVTTNYFSIDLACPENGDVLVKILNTSGVVLQKYIYPKESMFTTMQVSLGNVPVGSYLVEISIGEFREIKKVVVR